MTDSGASIARELLDRFEAAIVAQDVDALMAMIAERIALFGTSRANFGEVETREYLQLQLDACAAIRWLLDPLVVVHEDDEVIVVAGFGEVEVSDESGTTRAPFRLTLVLVQRDGEWRISHFHGSLPEAAPEAG